MLRSIIIDDEERSRESLKNMVTNFCPTVQVCAMCQNIAESVVAISEHKPNFVFLDVQMKRETGFDLFAQIPSVNFDVIFTTAHAEFAIQAIRYSAVDYLLKPIDIQELKNAVDRVGNKQSVHIAERLQHLLSNLQQGSVRKYRLALPTLEGMTFITAEDVIYCHASGNYTEIFTKDGKKYVVSRALKEYEDMLSDQNFFRIHHSWLINLDAVKSYVKGDGGYVIMSDNASLDVSRRRKESFLERIRQ